MREPRWLTRRMVLAVHYDLIRQHGGSHGLRDEGLLESALARPLNHWAYSEESEARPELHELAAAYGVGIAKNHPFVDGNKRVAFQAMFVFLGLNGKQIVASEPAVVEAMTGLADGSVDEDALAAWLLEHSEDRDA